MGRIAILISKIGGTGAIVFGTFLYLFKSMFKQIIEPLSKLIDRLRFNVDAPVEDTPALEATTTTRTEASVE